VAIGGRVLLVACAALTAISRGAVADDAAARPWHVTATAFLYVLPEQDNFLMVTAPADIRWLHLEGRYNYEALDSGAAFVGVNGAWGDAFKLHLTPMVGGVFGSLDGLVPALRWTLTWWNLDIYSESEVVIQFGDMSDSFFYNWSELGFSPLDWLRVGAVIQRSRIFTMPRDVQSGLFVSGKIGVFTASLYELNLGWETPTWVIALGASF
jgi:hypothetical protein